MPKQSAKDETTSATLDELTNAQDVIETLPENEEPPEVTTTIAHKIHRTLKPKAKKEEEKKSDTPAQTAQTGSYYQERITNLAEFVNYWREEVEATGETFRMLVDRLADEPLRPSQSQTFRRAVSARETLGVFPFVPDVAGLISDLQLANGESGGRFEILLMNEEGEPLTDYTDAGMWRGVITNPVIPPASETNHNGNGHKPPRERTLQDNVREYKELRRELTEAGLLNENAQTKEGVMVELLKDSNFLGSTMAGIATGFSTMMTNVMNNANPQPQTIGERVVNKFLEDDDFQDKAFTAVGSIFDKVTSIFTGRRGNEKRIERKTEKREEKRETSEETQAETSEEGVDLLTALMRACEANEPVNLRTDKFMLEFKEANPQEYTNLLDFVESCDSTSFLKMGIMQSVPKERKDEVKRILKLPHANAWLQNLIDTTKEGD